MWMRVFSGSGIPSPGAHRDGFALGTAVELPPLVPHNGVDTCVWSWMVSFLPGHLLPLLRESFQRRGETGRVQLLSLLPRGLLQRAGPSPCLPMPWAACLQSACSWAAALLHGRKDFKQQLANAPFPEKQLLACRTMGCRRQTG